MKTVDLEKWPRRKWWRLTLAIFTAQLLLALLLSSRAPLAARATERTTRWVLPGASAGNPAIPMVASDPLVFGSAHPAGFSGSAWLHPARTDYRVTVGADPADFLDFEEAAATNPLVQFSALAEVPGDAGLRLSPLLVAPTGAGTEARPGATIWWTAGELAGRKVLVEPRLIDQIGVDVVNNSVVQLAVRADGLPWLARIWKSSGSRAADLQAVAAAQAVRFAPEPGEAGGDRPLTWGWLEVQWFTREPPTVVVTNAPAL